MFEKAKWQGNLPNWLVMVPLTLPHAHKKQYEAKRYSHNNSEHVRHIHTTRDMNNNPMESFNGNAIRHREKVARGLNKEDSAIY